MFHQQQSLRPWCSHLTQDMVQGSRVRYRANKHREGGKANTSKGDKFLLWTTRAPFHRDCLRSLQNILLSFKSPVRRRWGHSSFSFFPHWVALRHGPVRLYGISLLWAESRTHSMCLSEQGVSLRPVHCHCN